MYNVIKITLILIFTFLGVNHLFALINLELVNSQIIEIDLAKTLSILYNSDNIVLLESNDNNLVLKEYMTRNKVKYYAEIETSEYSITMHNGKRPWLIRTRIEVYIPKIFTNNLSVNLRSGNITINNISPRDIFVEVSSGNIKLINCQGNLIIANRSGNVEVGNFMGEGQINVKSGNITLNNCKGKLNITNKSGIIESNSFIGEGFFNVNSGNINFTVNDILGNISLFSSSGNINFLMEDNISFILDAEVRSGNIRAPNIGRIVNAKVQHNIGIDPIYTLLAKCGSGNINIK